VLAALSTVYDAPRRDTPPAAGADLAAALAQLERTHRRRGRVVVVSDFLDDDWRSPLGALAHHHDVIAVHAIDQRELELPDVGMLRVVDAETGRLMEVQTRSATLRARYAAAAAERTAKIQRDIEATSALYLQLRTDHDWVFEMVRFLNTRRVAKRAVR
jgi:uncharacterized protein (DUF58 family)